MNSAHRLILVVGGHSQTASSVSDALRVGGYGVAGLCSAADDLLLQVEKTPCEVVLMDENLGPGHDAPRLARRLLDATGIPLVFFGPGSERSRFHRLRELEPLGFLITPFSEIHLRTTLDLAFHRLDKERERMHALPGRLAAHERLKEQEGLLPLCAGCKRITTHEGRWLKLEEYFARHAGVSFTHSLCPDCEQRLYGASPVEPTAPAARRPRQPVARKASTRA